MEKKSGTICNLVRDLTTEDVFTRSPIPHQTAIAPSTKLSLQKHLYQIPSFSQVASREIPS